MTFFGLMSELLFPILFGMLSLALVLRFGSYRLNRKNQIFYRELTSLIESEVENLPPETEERGIEPWFHRILQNVERKMPSRVMRSSAKAQVSGSSASGNNPSTNNVASGAEAGKSRRPEGEYTRTLSEFAHDHAVIIGLKQQIDVFSSPQRPNYPVVCLRVLTQDPAWQNVFGFIPTEMVNRFVNILPGLFVVGGIFGTFLGITAALPMIAQIDLNNLNNATPILNAFVDQVAFSMRTSIAGIVCSVIMTILNTIYPLEGIRLSIRRDMINCIEKVWQRIHGHQVSYGEARMIALLEELNAQLKKVS